MSKKLIKVVSFVFSAASIHLDLLE